MVGRPWHQGDPSGIAIIPQPRIDGVCSIVTTRGCCPRAERALMTSTKALKHEDILLRMGSTNTDDGWQSNRTDFVEQRVEVLLEIVG